MPAVLARKPVGSHAVLSRVLRAALPTALIVLATGAYAAGPAPLQVTGSSLPRFDATQGAPGTSRLDLTFVPPTRTGLGLSLGLVQPGQASGLAPFAPPSRTAVDLGLHWRHSLDSQYRLDVTAWRRMRNADAISLIESREPTYGARVEMGMASVARQGFVADRGFVGFQMEGGGRIMLRRSGGRPAIYYRNTF